MTHHGDPFLHLADLDAVFLPAFTLRMVVVQDALHAIEGGGKQGFRRELGFKFLSQGLYFRTLVLR